MASPFGSLSALSQAGSRLGGRARGLGNLNPPRMRGIGVPGGTTNAFGQTAGKPQTVTNAFGQTIPSNILQGHNLIPVGQLQPSYGAPTAAPAPAGPPAPKPPAPAPQPSPLDATYWANVNANQFNTNNKINALGQSETDAGTALQSALAKLDYSQPRASLALEENANRRGGLFSSVYNQQLGDSNYNYAGQRGGLASNYAQTLGNDQAQIAALQGGLGLYNSQQAADAAIRASTRAANSPAPPPAQAPAAKAPAAKPPSAKGAQSKQQQMEQAQKTSQMLISQQRSRASAQQQLARALAKKGKR